MKPSIQLRLSQQLTMTPQLQQAIRLLQLSALDLRTEVQEALESNPMLDMAEDEPAPAADANGSNSEVSQKDDSRDADAEVSLGEGEASIREELPVDSAWDDVYEGAQGYSGGADGEDQEFQNQGQTEETLQGHLLWQAQLTPFTERDQAIATAIIDAIDDRGYLTASLEDIRDSIGEDAEVELDEVEAVLHRVQNFDPPGVAARNLSECLLIQLRQLPTDTAWVTEAQLLVRDHLDLLGQQDLGQLMRRLKLSDSELRQVIYLIRSLDPRPGTRLAPSQAQYVTPDVLVRKHQGKWLVELNPEAAPRVRINRQYAALVRRADNSTENSYLRGQLQEARWFLKSLKSRSETLLKVATCIVEQQRGFLEYGEEAMKPLVLHDIATMVGMHESTISRVTTQKYMHTPRGIFELKYFFSSHVSTSSGGECSSTAIRALIKKLIAAENPARPLSDNKLASLLADQGIDVARRTIAKYREVMAIPPSNERKRLV